MNILVINGSPKGQYSITLQTVLYLERLHPEHRFTILHAGQRIRALEKDFSDALVQLQSADLILFCYPVYTFIAPSQLHRFIELCKANGAPLAGKYASQITTSKHFYDVTAHRYIMDNCMDMGMKCVGGLSADMDDLLTRKGRDEAEAFFVRLVWQMEKGYREPANDPLPAFTPMPVTAAVQPVPKKQGNVVIVADLRDEDASLLAMIKRFQAVLPYPTRVVNLREFPFGGGCLGCFHCASTGECVYKDGFDRFLRSDIQSAKAIVFAFAIRDHSMGALFKRYDDRQFCNGHRTVTMGMPMGYLISGQYSAQNNLQLIIEGRCEVGGNTLSGIATDEIAPDAAIDQLAGQLDYDLEHGYVQPANFLGVGGMKIFRDLIYTMRGMMKADHRFYKAHGQYDFPQKKKGTILKMYLVGALLSNKTVLKKMGNKMNEGMIAPYRSAIDKAIGEQQKKR